MQMIDVLKRLAELDAANPNRPEYKVQPEQNISVNEDVKVDECGMMGSMDRPSTPASINMTAASGEELSGMLKDIMSLAGVSSDAHVGHEEPVTGTDGMAVVDVDKDMDEPSIMRQTLDKLNLSPNEEKVDEWDNESADPNNFNMNNDAQINTAGHNQRPAGSPGAAEGRNLTDHPVATPETTYESLMADYKKFISEEQGVAEATGDTKFDKMMGQIVAEPKYPDKQMPPTNFPELIQWAEANNKPCHLYFAHWAQKNNLKRFKNVNDALIWLGDNGEDLEVDDPTEEERLSKAFNCYEKIWTDWPDEYRQMHLPEEGVEEIDTMESMLKLAGLKK